VVEGERVSLRRRIPWWAKVAAKLFLARLPIPYTFWKRLHLFEHGDMNRPERPWEVFIEHARNAGVLDKESIGLRTGGAKDYNVLEIGPGDSVATALVARALGASETWLVDTGAFATRDLGAYSAVAQLLKDLKKPVLAEPPVTFEGLLSSCHAHYLTEGVRSLNSLPPASIDFCFSNAVLEHIELDSLPALFGELRRVLKPTGVAIHRVDLKDHLERGLNNLRFSSRIWESSLFRRSGFYTNRVRMPGMVGLLERSGFSCEVTRKVRWESLPTPQSSLSEPFRSMPEEDLLISGFDVILRCGEAQS
jgi:SAM-dependent methyltransferase